MSHTRIRKATTRGGYLFPHLDYTASRAVRAGPLVYLLGQTGITLDGKDFVGAGDPAAQAENAMSCVAVLLDEAGVGIEDVCKIATYVTEREYRQLVYPVIARHLEGVYPVSTGIVVKGLAEPEIDFEIDVFAAAKQESEEGPMAHERFRKKNTKGGSMFPSLDFDLSRAVRAGNQIFLQGQTGMTLDGDGFVGEGSPAAQADHAMQNVRTLLEEAGGRMEDICKITTYVTNRSYREQVYPVIARHLKGVFPVSTGLVVKALAEPHFDFEIDVFAVVPDDRD